MTSIKVSLVFILFCYFADAQNVNPVDLRGDYVVISTSGLNFRDAPSLQSNIISTLAFGTKVTVENNMSFGTDTIGTYDFKYVDNPMIYKTDIIGNWVEVKYNNKTGYLFDAYLYRYYKSWRTVNGADEANLNEDYALLFHGSWCNYNFWFEPEFEWYGCYQEGEKFKLKKLNISFFRNWNSELTDIGISADNNIDLLFIIGSRKKLTEGNIDGRYNKNRWSGKFDDYDHLETRAGVNCDQLVLLDSGKEQVLNAHHKNYYAPSSIIWQGDLDNDGKLDYVIHYGEKSAKTYLYLSSEANEEQIVKPVAVFFSGYCC